MPLRAGRITRWFPLACAFAALPANGLLAEPTVERPAAQPVLAVATAATQPAATRPAAQPIATTRVLVARRGDTLTRLLASAGIDPAEAEPAIAALRPLFPPRALQPGHEVTLRQDAAGDDALLGLELEPQPGRIVTVLRSGGGWTAREALSEQRRHLVLAHGEVSGALFENLKSAGLPPPLALGLIRALAHEIDFQRDLQPGDSFTVLFERFRDPDGELLRHGEIVHAGFNLSGQRLSLWRYETEDGADWYDAEGRSLRRAFLRTPLDSARVTSGFGMRQHPVLGFTRMHQGVDFAAPAGTPVYAAADGVVTLVGTAGGYGRTVRLRHAGGTETRYAHLSAYARGLRPGGRVRQGDVIGRVGSTGMATGPHLHYEILADGRAMNPATTHTETTARLTGRDLAAFLAARRGLQTWLARLEPMQEVAAAD
jgi:murein DD-endopeptidase MepM/ murein hydrolase activator NlpD